MAQNNKNEQATEKQTKQTLTPFVVFVEKEVGSPYWVAKYRGQKYLGYSDREAITRALEAHHA